MNRRDDLLRLSILAVIAAALLSVLGLIMTLNASQPADVLDQPVWTSPFAKQLVALFAGMMLLALLSTTTFDRLRSYAWPLFIVTLILLGLVLVPGIGTTGGGARRRLGLGLITIQPSEFMKLALVLVLAHICARPSVRLTDGRTYASLLGLVLLVSVLVEKEPDLGTAFVIFATAVAVLYVAGSRWQHLALTFAVAIIVLAYLTIRPTHDRTGYRTDRLTAFLAPEEHKDDVAYQVVQSLIAVSRSGLKGVGIGNGESKHFLPASNTDYVMATVAEELGIVGVLFVMLAMGTIILYAHRVAMTASDPFTKLTAAGVGALLTVQSALNLAVVTNSIPSTGVPMPFVSYGSSSLVTMLAAVGILARPWPPLLQLLGRPVRSQAT